MLVTVGISNRHIHLTKEDFKTLFGYEEMTKKVDLSQPNNFACEEVLTVVAGTNYIPRVRVLGDFREHTQVELSQTDVRILGIKAPVRQSGDCSNAGKVTLVGPAGQLNVDSAIIAERHIHITKEKKEELGLPDVVSLKVSGEKSGVLGDVHLRIGDKAYYEAHLDTDDANAFRITADQEVEIIF